MMNSAENIQKNREPQPQDTLRAALTRSKEHRQTLLSHTEAIYTDNDQDHTWQILLETLSGEEADFFPHYYEEINPAGLTYPKPLRSVRRMIHGKRVDENKYSVLAGDNNVSLGSTCFKVFDTQKPFTDWNYRTSQLLDDIDLFDEGIYQPHEVAGMYIQGQIHFEELVEAVVDAMDMDTDAGIEYLELAMKTALLNTEKFPHLEKILTLSDQNTREMWLTHAFYSLLRNKNMSFAGYKNKLIKLAEETFVIDFVEELIREENKVTKKQTKRAPGEAPADYEFLLSSSEDIMYALDILRDMAQGEPDIVRNALMEMDFAYEDMTGAIVDILGLHTHGNRPMGIKKASRVYNVPYYEVINSLGELLQRISPPKRLSAEEALYRISHYEDLEAPKDLYHEHHRPLDVQDLPF